MSSQASGLRVASVIFALFAIGHAVRLIKQAQVTVASHQIPTWVSVVALIIAATLRIWMWRLSSAGGSPVELAARHRIPHHDAAPCPRSEHLAPLSHL